MSRWLLANLTLRSSTWVNCVARGGRGRSLSTRTMTVTIAKQFCGTLEIMEYKSVLQKHPRSREWQISFFYLPSVYTFYASRDPPGVPLLSCTRAYSLAIPTHTHTRVSSLFLPVRALRRALRRCVRIRVLGYDRVGPLSGPADCL